VRNGNDKELMYIHKLEGSVRNKDSGKGSSRVQESKSIPNPFQNQSKLQTGELQKGLDSWLENMEAETIAPRPLTLALILDIAGKLESKYRNISAIAPVFLDQRLQTYNRSHEDPSSLPPHLAFLFCKCSPLFKSPSSGSGSPGRVTRRVCFGVFARTKHRVYKPESRFCFLN
jgi:hypothetical protein